MEDYSDNFECNKDLKVSLEWEVTIYAYTDAREHAGEDGKWHHSDPRKMVLNIDDIRYFREQREDDRLSDTTMLIFKSTVMPTEWCLMVYHNKWDKKQHIIPVVGKADIMNERLDMLKDSYYRNSEIVRKLHNDMKNLYLNYTEE